MCYYVCLLDISDEFGIQNGTQWLWHSLHLMVCEQWQLFVLTAAEERVRTTNVSSLVFHFILETILIRSAFMQLDPYLNFDYWVARHSGTLILSWFFHWNYCTTKTPLETLSHTNHNHMTLRADLYKNLLNSFMFPDKHGVTDSATKKFNKVFVVW